MLRLRPNSPEIIRIIIESGHSRIPIYQDNIDNIVGTLHAKDLLPFWGTDDIAIREIMRPPYFIPETKKISEVLKDLRDNKSHMAIVIDEYGGTAGILTLEDIIEEIIGEVMDEYDAEQKLIIEHEDGSISVNARLDVEKLEDFLQVELPEGDFESVGGFIISLIGKVPEVNEKVIYDGIEIVIEAAIEQEDRSGAHPQTWRRSPGGAFRIRAWQVASPIGKGDPAWFDASRLNAMNAILLSILSGLLLTAGFPKPAMFYLAWVAFVPLLYAIRGKTGKQAFALGYICGLVHCLTCLFWIYHAIYHYGGFSTAVSFLFFLLLCCIMAVYPAVFALLAQRWEMRALALRFWAAVRMGCARMGPGVCNFRISVGKSGIYADAAKPADPDRRHNRSYGLSWLVVLGNTVISGFIRNFCRKSGLAVLAACIVCALLYGFWRFETDQ